MGIARRRAYLKLDTKTFNDTVLAVFTDIHNT